MQCKIVYILYNKYEYLIVWTQSEIIHDLKYNIVNTKDTICDDMGLTYVSVFIFSTKIQAGLLSCFQFDCQKWYFWIKSWAATLSVKWYVTSGPQLCALIHVFVCSCVVLYLHITAASPATVHTDTGPLVWFLFFHLHLIIFIVCEHHRWCFGLEMSFIIEKFLHKDTLNNLWETVFLYVLIFILNDAAVVLNDIKNNIPNWMLRCW